METVALQVGDLAKQTGVSVRTLHYRKNGSKALPF
jgi:hypothetical protein